MTGFTHSAAEYAELRQEYRKLTKETARKSTRAFQWISQIVILSGLASAVYGVVVDRMRFMWLLPLALAVCGVLAFIIKSMGEEDVQKLYGDKIFLRKLLRDDVVVVRGDSLKLVLGDYEAMLKGHTVSSPAPPVAVEELAEAVRHWDERPRPTANGRGGPRVRR